MSLHLAASVLQQQGAAGGPVVLDSFNRADSATSLGTADTGQVWTTLAGTWGIETNRAYSVTSAPADRQVVVDTGEANVTVETDLAALDTAGGAGLLFRGVDASNYWILTSENLPRWALYKRVAGTHTLVASINQTITAGRLSVVASGSSITCKHDGVTLFSATDTTHQAATRHGLRIYRTSLAPTWRFDDFTVEAL